MFCISRTQSWPPSLDLGTVKETLLYMRDDARAVPGLEKVSAALDEAIREIDVAERRSNLKALPTRFEPVRFLPRGSQ
ncbi:MAG: hypothetical protein NW216_04805 [Hyphomicrobium sp.]|nr:hypothetical protein [Hyphomicrobium sp.]